MSFSAVEQMLAIAIDLASDHEVSPGPGIDMQFPDPSLTKDLF